MGFNSNLRLEKGLGSGQRALSELKRADHANVFFPSPSFFFFFFFLSFCLFGSALMVYGGSQARGPIRATPAGLHHSHSNATSKPHLQPTPQLTATPDPQSTE